MNKQSADAILRENQHEAIGYRERKANEKKNRLLEERRTLDQLNRELEEEKRFQLNKKTQMIQEQAEDYQNFLKMKTDENPIRRRGERKDKDNLTIKIGSENREIKRKTYDDMTNALVLNPTREEIPSRSRGNIQEERALRPPIRGRSHGYNIINHSIYDNFNALPPTTTDNNNIRRVNMNDREMNQNSTNERFKKNTYQENVQIPTSLPKQQASAQVDGIENLENYQQESAAQGEEPTEEDYRRYYEYLRQKEEMMKNENQSSTQTEPDIRKNERPVQMYDGQQLIGNPATQESVSKHVQDPYVEKDIGIQMRNMNTAAEDAQKEYMINRNRNQHSNYNNITHTQVSNQGVNSQYKREIDNSFNSKKGEQQELYRNYLQAQVQEKKMSMDIPKDTSNDAIPKNPFTSNRARLSKNNNITSNPYSTKNYDFGNSALTTNPITNPVNSYQFNYNKYAPSKGPVTLGINREVPSARLRNLGNNIVNK